MTSCHKCGNPVSRAGKYCLCCGNLLQQGAAEPPAVKDDLIGTWIGGIWQMQKVIDEGWSGKTYAGRHGLTGQKVSIKVLPLDLARDERVRNRFQNEAALLAKLEHPHILTLCDYRIEEGRLFLVLEAMEGTSLDILLHKAPKQGTLLQSLGVDGNTLAKSLSKEFLPDEVIFNIFDASCQALSYAHGQNIVHRNLKPENVLIGEDSFIRLSGFGFARILGSTAVTQTLGTLAMGHMQILYMAPEVVIGDRPVDQRADVYSLAMLFYEMLSGRLPYRVPPQDMEFMDFLKYLGGVDGVEFLPLSSVVPDVPPALNTAIMRALSCDPAQRPWSIEEMQQEVLQSSAPAEGTLTPAEGPFDTIRMDSLPKPSLEPHGAKEHPSKAPEARGTRGGSKALLLLAALLLVFAALLIFFTFYEGEGKSATGRVDSSEAGEMLKALL